MPRTLKLEDGPRLVATEDELLAFANAIRQAGGANALEALLPSRPGDTAQCLIANALNFGCHVEPMLNLLIEGERCFRSGAEKWVMRLPANLTPAQREALGRVEGVRLRKAHYHYHPHGETFHFLTLPEAIGNAAAAFDEGMAFQHLVDKEDS